MGERERQRVGLACSVETKRGGRMSTAMRECLLSLCLSFSLSLCQCLQWYISLSLFHSLCHTPFFSVDSEKEAKEMASKGSMVSHSTRHNNTITPFSFPLQKKRGKNKRIEKKKKEKRQPVPMMSKEGMVGRIAIT